MERVVDWSKYPSVSLRETITQGLDFSLLAWSSSGYLSSKCESDSSESESEESLDSEYSLSNL
jgi:hypothetical protein